MTAWRREGGNGLRLASTFIRNQLKWGLPARASGCRPPAGASREQREQASRRADVTTTCGKPGRALNSPPSTYSKSSLLPWAIGPPKLRPQQTLQHVQIQHVVIESTARSLLGTDAKHKLSFCEPQTFGSPELNTWYFSGTKLPLRSPLVGKAKGSAVIRFSPQLLLDLHLGILFEVRTYARAELLSSPQAVKSEEASRAN